MKQFHTRAIVLKRVDYQEADRILTLLTEDHGKVAVMARGVRKSKSKMAGGIELLTVNEVTIIEGKSELRTLRSSRMQKHFPLITKDYARLQAGYEFIRAIDKVTEEVTESEYFDLLLQALNSLDDTQLDLYIVELWFRLQLLALQGRQPNLSVDGDGQKLQADQTYHFDTTEGQVRLRGPLQAEHIKLARLALQLEPAKLAQIKNGPKLAKTWLSQLPTLASH